MADPGFASGMHGIARSASLNGGLGRAGAPAGSRAEPLVRGHVGFPPEAEGFWSIFIQKSGQMLRM